MARTFFTHDSASLYWAHHDVFEARQTRCIPSPSDTPNRLAINDAKRLVVGSRADEVHISVASRAQTCNLKNIKMHYREVPYPQGSFYRIANDVYVASPELCFLQAANTLSLPALILYGYELCGTYARVERLPKLSGAQKQALQAGMLQLPSTVRYKRDPLTTVADLAAYLRKATAATGSQKALEACGYIIDGSASVRESQVVVLIILPPRLGGAGLPHPKLNHPIEVNEPSPYTPGTLLTLHGDAVWPDAKLVVEYDGTQHGLVDNHVSDKRRDHLMLEAGYKVIRMTNDSIRNLDEVERLIRTINAEGRYKRKKSSLEIDSRSIKLHDALLRHSDLPWLPEAEM